MEFERREIIETDKFFVIPFLLNFKQNCIGLICIFFGSVLLFIFLQICRCEDETCCLVHPPFHWLLFPKNDKGNLGHYKPFSAMYGAQNPTEEHIPSNVNNVRKVLEQEQVSSKLQTLEVAKFRLGPSREMGKALTQQMYNFSECF